MLMAGAAGCTEPQSGAAWFRRRRERRVAARTKPVPTGPDFVARKIEIRERMLPARDSGAQCPTHPAAPNPTPPPIALLHRSARRAKETAPHGGGLAERLRSGLQIRADRFDSGTRLQISG